MGATPFPVTLTFPKIIKTSLSEALPNALNPVLTSLGLSLGSMLSGAVIVENVFAWPGMGRVIVRAVAGRDYPVIQGYILVIAAVYIVLNLGVDILCAMLNPRIFTEEET